MAQMLIGWRRLPTARGSGSQTTADHVTVAGWAEIHAGLARTACGVRIPPLGEVLNYDTGAGVDCSRCLTRS